MLREVNCSIHKIFYIINKYGDDVDFVSFILYHNDSLTCDVCNYVSTYRKLRVSLPA